MAGLIMDKKFGQEGILNNEGTSQTVDPERRKYPRFLLNLPVEILHKDSRKQLSHTVDIGENGLTLYITPKLEVGQYLQLKLFFSYNSSAHVLDLSGKIIWIKNQSEGNNVEGGHIAGINFVNRSVKEMKELRNFLNYLDLEVRVANHSPQR